MALILNIDGVDRSSYLAHDTLNISQEATTRIAVCSFVLNDPDGALTITSKLSVHIYDAPSIDYFHGSVSTFSIEQMTPNNSTAVRYYIRCQDDHLELDKRIVTNETYASSVLNDIERIADLFGTYYSSGIDYSTYVVGSALIDPMQEQEFICITLRDAIRRICDHSGGNFYVHYDNATIYFHYYDTEVNAASWALTDDNPNGSTTFGFLHIEEERDSTALTNAVYMEGGDQAGAGGVWAGWRTDAASISTYGRHEKAILATELDVTAGTTVSDQILDDFDLPLTTYRVTCRNHGILRAGMYINLTWTARSISSQAFLINRLRVFQEGGETRLELELNDTGLDIIIPEPGLPPIIPPNLSGIPSGGTPEIALSTAVADGVAATFLRSDATVLAFDATNPTTIECDDAAAIGVAAIAARRDHKHGIVCAAAITLTATTTNAEGNATSFARSNHLHTLDATIARSAIIITAGDGLTGGGNLTANRTITLGTPGTLTATTTNSVTATSHAHAIDSTLARAAIIITAGNGLTGGGNLTVNRTITMGTPGTLTVSTTNGVTATSHTHTITESSNPGAAAVILATNASGYLQLLGLGIGVAAGASNRITIVDGGTIGQAAGPLITFDDSNNYLEIGGCSVVVGGTVGSAKLHIIQTAVSNKHFSIDRTVAIEDGEAVLQLFSNDSSVANTHIVLTSAPGAGNNKHWILSHFGVDASNDFAVGYMTSAASGFTEHSATNRLRITIGGGVYINDSANAFMTQGLTINQGASDNEILALKASGVAHGVTDIAETDTFLSVKKLVAAEGGVNVQCLTETTRALLLYGMGATDNTTKTTGGHARIELIAALKTGMTVTYCGTNANLVAIMDYGTTRFLFDKEGSAHADVEWTTFAEHDDVDLLKRLEDSLLEWRNPVKQQFGDWMKGNRMLLEKLGVVHFDDGNPGHAMLNTTRLAMLHTGAIRQLAKRCQKYEQVLIGLGAMSFLEEVT